MNDNFVYNKALKETLEQNKIKQDISFVDSYNKKITKIIIVNLLLNYIWTVIFFKFNLYIVAAIDLLLLIVSTVTLICELYKENKKIGISEIPYLLWLLFAFYLNLGIVFLN